jgi:hypothetical protein
MTSTNSFAYFSAAGTNESQKRDVDPGGRFEDQPESPIPVPEDEPAADDPVAVDLPEEDYRTADEEEADSAPPSLAPPTIKKKVKVDRTQLFLSRQQVSRVGRESKKIERYDPSSF